MMITWRIVVLSPRGLKIDQRRKRILDMLSRNGQVWVSELSAELGATPVTIRSDLAALGEEGLLERITGGAVSRSGGILSRDVHHAENREAKLRIAAAAAELILDGETLFINSGTTAYYTARELKIRKNLKVVTNSIPVALELGDVPGFRVILLGGDINVQYSFTYGNNTLEHLRQYRANKTILSMDGIRADVGLTTYHAEEAVVNRLMMERSEGTIVVADRRKLGYESFSFVSGLSSVSCLITDAGEGEHPAMEEFKKSGLRIITTA
jgi:DeoR/GlpR family transcriptional regulator of sugar metabolism